MSDWESEGLAEFEGIDEALNWVLPASWQTHVHDVTNGDDTRQVTVNPGQTVGEAIANGQWKD